ncbi:InlB B-repeat-containing protein [Bifidobacterium aerophilum]|uniref:LPXTG cell wall anchor domain-containing protein n=1 Tax=Bifidobacterium aerophilum TaxID=1798155 RepID=A0A6N9Z5W4_9BIFI|nr:InlB B-repeat-containing protein [Bifidobacterium aerophilum]NEG89826.1 LPXTG cell wall anchor domain-containing protein [Bifidobacterium aerophilum]
MKTHSGKRLTSALAALGAAAICLMAGVPAAQAAASMTVHAQAYYYFSVPGNVTSSGNINNSNIEGGGNNYDSTKAHTVTAPTATQVQNVSMWSRWPSSSGKWGENHDKFSGNADYEFVGWHIPSNFNRGETYSSNNGWSWTKLTIKTPTAAAGKNIAPGSSFAGPVYNPITCTNSGGNVNSVDCRALVSKFIGAIYIPLIRFDGNGATSGSVGTDGPHMQNNDLEADWLYTMRKSPYARTGYTFTGWNTKANGSGTWYQPGDVVNMGKAATLDDMKDAKRTSLALYAQWTADPITIRYDGNGATSGTTASQTTGRNVPIAISQNGFTWNSHEFQGWNTKADGTGTSYKPGDKHAFSSNTTLYAQWKTLNATIRYDGNGATSGTVADQTDQIGKTVQVRQNGFTRDSYIFKQWNTKPDGTGTAYAPTADVTIPADGMTLYAIWTPVSTTMPSTGGSGLMLSLGGGIAGLLVCLASLMLRRKRRS